MKSVRRPLSPTTWPAVVLLSVAVFILTVYIAIGEGYGSHRFLALSLSHLKIQPHIKGQNVIFRGRTMDMMTSRRESVLQEMHEIVQRSFASVQYPASCDNVTSYLVCDMKDHPAGFGSRIHAIVFCHHMAYSLGRVLVLKDASLGGMDTFLQGLDSKCAPKMTDMIDVKTEALWDSAWTFDNSVSVLFYRHRYGPFHGPLPGCLPHSVPSDIVDILQALDVNHVTWFVSQSVHFISGRLKQPLIDNLKEVKAKLQLRHPYAALHIRHGDKVKQEAKYISAHAYMEHIRAYFTSHHQEKANRMVFVASDDVKAVKELRSSNTLYRFFSRESVIREAASTFHGRAYQPSVIKGLLTDLFLLAESDFVVCTLSSNIGRLVYELRYALNPRRNLTASFVSMDSEWYYEGPGYLFRLPRNDEFGYVVARRDKAASRLDGLSYVSLTHNRWYEASFAETFRNGTTIKLIKPAGHVLLKDVLAYPPRTQLKDGRLKRSLGYIKSSLKQVDARL